MPKFENKYIHCVFEEELIGKKVFYSDLISELRKIVEGNDQTHADVVIDYYAEDYPFSFGGNSYFSFCYYDPYYEIKIALEQGKTIQGKTILTGEWVDMAGKNIDWDNVDGYELRIKPDEPEESKPVTNRELARWLARGNGEFKQLNGVVFSALLHYWSCEENTPAEVLIRKWEDTEWVIPTREYMGLE